MNNIYHFTRIEAILFGSITFLTFCTLVLCHQGAKLAHLDQSGKIRENIISNVYAAELDTTGGKGQGFLREFLTLNHGNASSWIQIVGLSSFV